MGLFREFYKQDPLKRSLNATFLVLVPKKGGVETRGFERLQTNKFGGEVMQTFGLSACFVEDRKILHATLIANETETKSWESFNMKHKLLLFVAFC